MTSLLYLASVKSLSYGSAAFEKRFYFYSPDIATSQLMRISMLINLDILEIQKIANRNHQNFLKMINIAIVLFYKQYFLTFYNFRVIIRIP